MILAGNTLRREKFELVGKLEKHDISLGEGLELSLTEWGGLNYKIAAYISLPGFNDKLYTVKEWNSKEEALNEFSEIKKKFKQGNYTLHIYNNGEIKVEF